jgi:hypothetical protein
MKECFTRNFSFRDVPRQMLRFIQRSGKHCSSVCSGRAFSGYHCIRQAVGGEVDLMLMTDRVGKRFTE